MRKNVERMRYQNDSLPFWLCIIGIVFNIVYFIGIYRSRELAPDVTFGVDVVYNIVFMLITFLASEKTKTYARGWPFVLFLLGAIQALRVLWIPARFLALEQLTRPGYWKAFAALIASGASLVAAGSVSLLHAAMLRRFLSRLNPADPSEE